MVPIIIGITGHRDLREEDIPDLEKKVRGIFQEIRDKYKKTPIKVLSPLAEGADRLVAKVALETGKTGEARTSLIAILPMSRSEYEKDFETEESKKEFAELLTKAEDVYELPLLEGNTLENTQEYGSHRNTQYAFVGAYVALHSQILIALWNGKDTRETGGTAEIVRFKLEGVPEPYAVANQPLDLPDNGVVYHIFTRREKKNSEITENNHAPEVNCLPVQAGQWDILYPPGWKDEKQAAEYYYGILQKIDTFNADAKILASTEVVKSKGYILVVKNKEGRILSEIKTASCTGLTEILDGYANADIAAQNYQKTSDNALKWLLSLPVIAFFFFGAFDELWSMAYMLALFPVFFGVAYFIYKHTAKKEHDRKFSDYRVLAEGLRVQFFWKLAGLRENVTDHYHRKYKAEMNWIFYAIRNVSIKANMEVLKHPASGIKEKLQTVKTHWIEDQEKYYVKNAVKRTTLAEKAENFTTRFFVIAMVLVLGLFAMKAIILLQQGSLENIVDMNDIKNWTLYSVFLVLIDTFIATGAARAVYVEKKGFNEEAKQFQRMRDLFQKGSNVMIECLKKDDLKGAERLVIELGKEALTENGDWLILRRSKPMEVPLG